MMSIGIQVMQNTKSLNPKPAVKLQTAITVLDWRRAEASALFAASICNLPSNEACKSDGSPRVSWRGRHGCRANTEDWGKV